MNSSNLCSAAAILVGAVLLSACDHRQSEGSGPVRTETRDVGSFDAVYLRGDARLEITVGETESVTVIGRDSALRSISTEVSGDTLHVRSKGRDLVWTSGDPRVTLRITVPKLESLRLRGGNDVRLAGFDGGDSKIRVEGAAHIKANGRLDELTVYMAGAGHADFSNLLANEAKVTVDGVGSVYVNTKDSLDATMNGVGAILYSGNPREVNTSMNGLGTIARRDGHSRHRDGGAKPKIDPDALQPEYEKEAPLEKVDSTEVI